jgi:AcrR family transcriptional regulator
MDRAEVARHQRTRLFGAMIEANSQRGYRATTVAHVIGLAGVSRRAFYEQFSNKEECFLSTYDIVVARSRKRVLDAWQRERGWENRLHAATKAFLDDLAAEPKGARLMLIDALGIGPRVRERMHLAGTTYERLLAFAFKLAPDRVPLPPLTCRAIVGGVRHVAFKRLREQRERELYNLADELLDWIEAYRVPAATKLCAVATQNPPHVPPSPAAFLSGEDKRSRVLSAVVHLTLDQGYAALTDPQIAQFAGVSTEAFHKQFPNKEECFLAVMDEFAREALDAVKTAAASASAWPEAVRLAVRAFIEYFVAHPALIRMGFIDLFEVGPGMIDRMTKSIDIFTGLLNEGSPPPRRGPEIVSEAIVGATWELLSSYAPNDRVRYLPCLADHLTFIVLAPYIGPKKAIETIEQGRKRQQLTVV